MRVLLDTNVILDVALRRPGLFEGSKRALETCENNSHEMFISWHTLSNLFYILRRDRGAEKTIEFLRHLVSITTVATVGHRDALHALAFGLHDFEDAMQLSAAEACGVGVILTRNKSDFGKPANVHVLSPDDFTPPEIIDAPSSKP